MTGARRALGQGFATLLTASATSNLADGVIKAALPLIAMRWTDSPALVSGVLAVLTLPWLLFALPAGLLVDRLDRRRSMIAANTLRALTLALVAVSVASGTESIWLLYAAAFALGSAETVHDTAAQSVLPSLVDRDLLERANGRLTAAEVTTNTFVGPPLGGFLVASAVVLGIVGPAALWAVAVAVTFALRTKKTPAVAGRQPWLSDIAGGLRFVWSHTLLRTMALMVGLCNIATSAFLATFVVYAVGPTSTLQATDVEYGALLAAAGAGSLIGALSTAKASAVLGRGRVLILVFAGMALFIGAPSVIESTPLLFATFLIGGSTVSGWNVISVAFRQRVTPDHLLGRVNSVNRLLAWGTIPLGAILGGALAELIGLQTMFAVAAAVAVLPLLGLQRVNETSMRHAEELG